jgi:hypothetical protein
VTDARTIIAMACPHCRKPIDVQVVLAEAGDRAPLLLDYLGRPPTLGKGPRHVYQAARAPNEWYLTYSADLPKYTPFTRADVDRLKERKLIVRAYPDCDTGYMLATFAATPSTDPGASK